MIERVHIVENWQACGHQVVIIGRQYPGAPRAHLTADGGWEPLPDDATSMNPGSIGFHFPEGALDALVAAARNVTPTEPAAERHLADTIAVRDRLLALVEKTR